MTTCCPHVCVSAEELAGLLLAHFMDDVAAVLSEEHSIDGADENDNRAMVSRPPVQD